MKYAFASALAALLIAGGAIAQTTPPTPAMPAVPATPSTCPAYPAQPAVPTAEAIKTVRDLNTSTATVNAYLTQYTTVHQCHVAEIDALKAQLEARVAEAKAAQDGALAFRNNWQTVSEAVTARGAAKQKDNRTGRQ